MLMSVTQRCDDLEEELAIANKKLNDRRVDISESGSLAEAVLRINGVMEAVDKAGVQYLENLKRMSGDGSLNLDNIKLDSASSTKGDDAMSAAEFQEKYAHLIEETKAKCQKIEEETKARCARMIEEAKRESQAYWDEVYSRIEQYNKATASLKDLLKNLPSAAQ